MLLMKYNGLKTEYPVNFKKVSSNIVRIIGEVPAKTHGFTLSRPGKEDAWDYSTYKTIYREMEGGIQFSNDGSVYVEPEPIPEPEPYVPTEEELQAMFEMEKQGKIEDTKILLALYLAENPLLSMAHGGEAGLYAVTSEKQALMMSQYMTYQIEKQINPAAVLTWNKTGEVCEVWTEEEFLQLILEIKQYVYPLVSWQQVLEKKIAECTTKEELEAIVINYSEVARA